MSAPGKVRPAGQLSFTAPPGYLRMPLADAAEYVDEARRLFDEVATSLQRELVDSVTQGLRVMLADLATAGAVYCGFGRHTSPTDGSLVTSTLVVSAMEFPGPSDPRAVLELLQGADAEDGGAGAAEITTTDTGRPVALRERVRTLPAPSVPGSTGITSATVAPVYQLSVRIPSFDGTRLATVELSTPFVADGQQFRTMVFQLAAAAHFGDEPDE